MAKISCLETVKESSYILSKHGLLFTGKITPLDILKIVLNFLFSILIDTLVILNIKNAIRVNNMRLANWMICVLVPMLFYSARTFTLLVNKQCLVSLLKDLNSDIFNGHSEDLNRHVRAIKTISSVMLRYFGTAAAIFILVYSILPFAINIRMMIPPPFNTGRYDILYKLCHLIAIIYLGLNAVCLDIFYITLMGLAIAQLNILQERLIEILPNAKAIQSKICPYETLATVASRIVKDCVVQHEMIIL